MDSDVRALVVVPNKLGSTDFGTFAYAGAYVGFFALIGGLGTSLFLSRAIARDYSLMGSYIWNGVLLKLAVWAVLAPAAVGLAYALGNRGQTLLLIAIACAGMLPYLLSEVFFGGLTGMQRIARPAMWQVVQTYFATVAGILVLELGGGVVPFTIIMNIGSVDPDDCDRVHGAPVRPRTPRRSTSGSGVCSWSAAHRCWHSRSSTFSTGRSTCRSCTPSPGATPSVGTASP